MYIHPYTSIHIHTHQYTSIHINTHQYTCIHINTHQYTPIHINTHPYTSIHINTHQYTSIHINTHLYTSIHINTHQYTSIHINTHQYTSIHNLYTPIQALDLSVDRKASDPEEISRIAREGGFVSNNRVLGTLAVSRAMGDSSIKETSDKPILVADPELSCFQPVKGDEFIVLAR